MQQLQQAVTKQTLPGGDLGHNVTSGQLHFSMLNLMPWCVWLKAKEAHDYVALHVFDMQVVAVVGQGSLCGNMVLYDIDLEVIIAVVQGKVVFVAPTKPLVNQQIQACYEFMGVSKVFAR